GRGDELRQEQLVKVRIADPINFAKRRLEGGKGISDLGCQPERAAKRQGDPAAPRPDREEVERSPQVLRRGGTVPAPLGQAELDEQLGAHSRLDLLFERAREV